MPEKHTQAFSVAEAHFFYVIIRGGGFTKPNSFNWASFIVSLNREKHQNSFAMNTPNSLRNHKEFVYFSFPKKKGAFFFFSLYARVYNFTRSYNYAAPENPPSEKRAGLA